MAARNDHLIDAFKDVFLFDISSKRGLQKLNSLLFILLVGLYLHSYVIPIELDRLAGSYLIYVALFILYFAPQVVDVVLFARDDLQYDTSGKNPYAAFFQRQFPSRYIMEKFGLDEKTAVTCWFKIFNKWQSDQHPNSGWRKTTFERGYRCRVVYYLQRWSWRFFVLGIISLLIIAGLKLWEAGSILAVLGNVQEIPSFWWKVGYPFAMVGVYGWLRVNHKANQTASTGVWRKWQEINDIMKTWLDQNAHSIQELEELGK